MRQYYIILHLRTFIAILNNLPSGSAHHHSHLYSSLLLGSRYLFETQMQILSCPQLQCQIMTSQIYVDLLQRGLLFSSMNFCKILLLLFIQLDRGSLVLDQHILILKQ